MRDRKYTTIPSGPEAPIEVNSIGLTPVMVAARSGHAAVVKGWVDVEGKFSRYYPLSLSLSLSVCPQLTPMFSRWAPLRARPRVTRRTSARAGASVIRDESGGPSKASAASAVSPASSPKSKGKNWSKVSTATSLLTADSATTGADANHPARIPYCICERDPNGWTALHWALHAGCTEGAAHLVSGGADVNATDFVSAE